MSSHGHLKGAAAAADDDDDNSACYIYNDVPQCNIDFVDSSNHSLAA